MKHHFEISVAKEAGIPAAVIFENVVFWICHNERTGRNFHDGKVWTFSSVKAYADVFPYLSEKQIRGALEKLIEKGFIEVGNFNRTRYDRTRWFALTEKGKAFARTQENDLPVKANGKAAGGTAIPNRKTDKGNKIDKRYTADGEQDFSRDPFAM